MTLSNMWKNTERPPLWVFDGLDLEALPEQYKIDNDVCETLYVDCLLDHTHDHPVCTYEVNRFGRGRFIDFVSVCDADYENCKFRENDYYIKNKYGKSFTDIKYYYEGDHIDCVGTPEADRNTVIKQPYYKTWGQTLGLSRKSGPVFEKKERGFFLPKDKQELLSKLKDVTQKITFTPEAMEGLRSMLQEYLFH